MKIDLSGKWKLYFYDATEKCISLPTELSGIDCIDCTVPGNVELDLCEAGYLPKDIFKGENIILAEKYDTYDFWYEREFDGSFAKAGEKYSLKFCGVDCIAEYFLNGESIGKSDNMLIPFELDITDKIKSKSNILQVKLSSALLYENDIETSVYSADCSWRTSESINIRKAPHSYGWDIMPRAISAGIWRSVYIEKQEECAFSQVYVVTRTVNEGYAGMNFIYDIKIPGKYYKTNLKIKAFGKCGDSEFSCEKEIRFKAGSFTFGINNPKLWWPYGYGDANLYEVKISLYSNDGVICEKTVNIGVRTVKLIRMDKIHDGENCFRFVINNTDIVLKGSNWVPLDAYHSRDAEKYEKALSLVKDIGCNVLRCWGGNVYEQDRFFELCDKYGVMIWQDFTMGCNLYPQNPTFYEMIYREAESVIKAYRQHPSIILWSGDNECDMIQVQPQMGVNPNIVNKITREVLPACVHNNDVARPYLESSPFVSNEIFETKRFDLMPEDHLWGPRDYYKSDFYKSSKAHFVSETGYHGCPSPKSIERFIDKEYLWPCTNNRQWNLHSTDRDFRAYRVDLMIDQIRQLFNISPNSLEEFSFASQISQAEADKYFIERLRMKTPKTGGIIWWNILDGWPQMSDAVVDYYFVKKIAYDYIKRSQAPFCIMCGENFNLALPIFAVNDTLTPKSGHFTVEDGESAKILCEGDYRVPENSKKQIASVKADFSEKRLLIIKWNGGANHYISGYVPFELEVYKKWYEIIKALN